MSKTTKKTIFCDSRKRLSICNAPFTRSALANLASELSCKKPFSAPAKKAFYLQRPFTRSASANLASLKLSCKR
ncbi:MAG: hypothetical protein V4635_07150, partial [Bacteroidota bacterium]